MPTWNVGLNDLAKQCISTAFLFAAPEVQLSIKISKQDQKSNEMWTPSSGFFTSGQVTSMLHEKINWLIGILYMLAVLKIRSRNVSWKNPMKYPNPWLRWNSKRPTISFLFLVPFFPNTNAAFFGALETLLITMRATLILKLPQCPPSLKSFPVFLPKKMYF